ncbi:DNA (cytosine-5-)-methyltransferase [Sulfitobacter geojensis]|uniref:Cytosine-specific methyltransferase n=3 Tax=Sulfitobacter geojensis TaxID=1342299 RepID=A0AAE2W2B1_9RHOB|nr:DNA cytosine methyltransferase [Sulfitobacter geojensis]MBM1695589.1 DNA cytosine methyltransferase [Sulfitobacter geojensis]MBM1711813.1 DNA cytosine methyltransferase [Sulfitobacter geojensis]MBM1715882.1 DNA cytosine methyltransferase [Sulfitobacter geojensis]MBM1719946.1 DNA cytosine methyltransferase [Sulfitobacter geojensis]
MKPTRVASFFAGAGGLDLGFKQAGFDIVYASDIESDCCETLKLNRGSSTSDDSDIHCGDIRTIDFNTLPDDIDLVVGGPPCQSFSASGRRAGGAAGRLDDRGNLFEAYRDIIRHLQPQAFVFENVRGILATNKGQDWAAIVAAFNELGYAVNYRLLDAADYGVPQHRERMFLVGHRLDIPFLFPRPLFGPDSLDDAPHVSPKDAFKGLKVRNSEAEGLKFEGGKYSHLLPEVPEGQNYLFFTAKRGHPNPVFAYRSRFSDFLYKAHRGYPMKTIIASPGKYTGPLHWDNRYFSISEYKAIQGFPQDYVFYGERASVVKQIGNSVSPKIAFCLAQAVAHQIFGGAQELDLLGAEERLTFDGRKGAKAAKTRVLHGEIQRKRNGSAIIAKGEKTFQFSLSPRGATAPEVNVKGTAKDDMHHLDVFFENRRKLTAEVVIEVWSSARDFSGSPTATLNLSLYGTGLSAPQLLWNAVDEWVRSVSSFGSLFELYGHFTEPYPFFQISRFQAPKNDAILQFAKYVSDFSRCSKYLDKNDLMNELASTFGASTFDELATCLRDMRYDVRTRETNIAIPHGKYMIAYPFTLPQSKQMNFSVKKPKNARIAASYITEKRVSF